MPLREDLLNPIPGDNPGGQDLRYDPVYDKIKEARREEDTLNQGAWAHERKVADWALVIKLTQEAIATRSKDLQLAAWLAEALLKKEGFPGLAGGLDLIQKLLESFWDHLYPEIEDGDLELRATPLNWIATKFEDPVKYSPLVRDGYGWYIYKESRLVGFEDQAKTDQQKKDRDKKIKEGKVAPEAFDKSFTETPKAFYAGAEKAIDAAMATLKALDELCNEKFGDSAPSFGRLRNTLEEVRHTVHPLLEKKRELEPDPVEAVAEAGEGAAGGPSAGAAGGFFLPAFGPAEPPERKEAIDKIAAAAAYLRKREPHSPAPYLLMRGLRWGELRAAAAASDTSILEGPPTELRQIAKRLALDRRWADLLEVAESAMALPCSRAWLDLQRLVVEACSALGTEYDAIAIAIRSELRALLRDLPQMLEATLLDDTPAANPETRAWLRDLLEEPASVAPKPRTGPEPVPTDGAPGWQRKFVDGYQLALEAQRSGQEQKAFEILQAEVERQRSGRGRFQRKLQLVQLCLATGKDTVAQPLLDDLAAAVDNHKLEDWEDRELIAAALATILRASKKVQGDAKEKQKLFDRICRLDPVQAMSIS